MATGKLGVPASSLDDEALRRELRQLWRTREETIFRGSAAHASPSRTSLSLYRCTSTGDPKQCLAPPLHVMWAASAVLALVLVAYMWLLLSIKHHAAMSPHERTAAANARPRAAARVAATAHRYVAEGRSAFARPSFNGLGSLGEGDRVHVVVRPASQAAGS